MLAFPQTCLCSTFPMWKVFLVTKQLFLYELNRFSRNESIIYITNLEDCGQDKFLQGVPAKIFNLQLFINRII